MFTLHYFYACKVIVRLSSAAVEDALASPTCDILNGSSQDQGIRKILGNEEDKQDVKLVGELM